MENIQCFFLEPTDMARISLRRYSAGETTCPGGSYHNGERLLGDLQNGLEPAFGPALWPVHCDSCAYEFTAADIRLEQVFKEALYRRSDNSQLTTVRQAPVGAMWYAPWLTGMRASPVHKDQRGNGPHLCLKTPSGDWDIDAPSLNGNGWDRSGTPPAVTANPSILFTGGYHGWLREGILTEV